MQNKLQLKSLISKVNISDSEEFFENSSYGNCLKPFQSNVTFLYPLKTSENLQFSEVFREYIEWVNDNNVANTILTIHKSQDVTLLQQISRRTSQGHRNAENLLGYHGGNTQVILSRFDIASKIFNELISQNSLSDIQNNITA